MTKPSATSSEWKHAVLPADAIARLQAASRTPITSADPLARVKAVEKANQWVRYTYPQFFQ